VDQSVHNIRVDDCELMQWPVSLPMTDLALLGHIMGHPAEVGEEAEGADPAASLIAAPCAPPAAGPAGSWCERG
jgi:hypothetical protein